MRQQQTEPTPLNRVTSSSDYSKSNKQTRLHGTFTKFENTTTSTNKIRLPYYLRLWRNKGVQGPWQSLPRHPSGKASLAKQQKQFPNNTKKILGSECTCSLRTRQPRLYPPPPHPCHLRPRARSTFSYVFDLNVPTDRGALVRVPKLPKLPSPLSRGVGPSADDSAANGSKCLLGARPRGGSPPAPIPVIRAGSSGGGAHACSERQPIQPPKHGVPSMRWGSTKHGSVR